MADAQGALGEGEGQGGLVVRVEPLIAQFPSKGDGGLQLDRRPLETAGIAQALLALGDQSGDVIERKLARQGYPNPTAGIVSATTKSRVRPSARVTLATMEPTPSTSVAAEDESRYVKRAVTDLT